MDTIVNDFTMNIATANGTGSQSANLILLHTMFEMGVPVSGKNLFPSNISGLPTWYIVRVSESGYQAPGDRTHIQVLMNKDTWEKDLAAVEPGTVIIYNSDVKLPVELDDVIEKILTPLGSPVIVGKKNIYNLEEGVGIERRLLPKNMRNSEMEDTWYYIFHKYQSFNIKTQELF